jgi:hypothetical protein
MLRVILVSIASIFLLSASVCKPKAKGAYKGRLEIAGICMHYTLSVLEGNIDSSKTDAEWTDEQTGKTYKKAFTLDDPCGFPKDIHVGDEFYFNIDTSTAPKPCTQCEAFYPTPGKSLRIIVTDVLR